MYFICSQTESGKSSHKLKRTLLYQKKNKKSAVHSEKAESHKAESVASNTLFSTVTIDLNVGVDPNCLNVVVSFRVNSVNNVS